MTTQELKEYINSKLGNSLRTLLPSYWWKRLFGLVVDRVEEVDNKVEELKNSSDYITFYLTSDPNSEWAEKNYVSFLKARQILEAGNTCPILIQTSHDENFGSLFTDTYVTGGIEYNLYMLTLPKVQFGRSTCNIHLIPFDKAATCEVERLTFEDQGPLAKDTWAEVKSVELRKELSDITESLPINRIVEYDILEDIWVTSPWTIMEEGPSFIYGFIGNSEIVDGKIENADLSTVTLSGNITPNYTLKEGWYDTEGKFNETDARIGLMRTRICSSEISVIPNKKYAIVSETNNFGIEIFEYDEQKNFIQKTNKVITSNRFGLLLASSSITFTENTKYITFNLYNHGNDLSQTDIVFLDASQPYSSTRINYGVSGQDNLSRGVLRGLPAGRDTIIGSVYTKRVGTRKYQDGDVNSDYLLTDGTTTLYVLNPDEYEIQTSIPRGISFLGTGVGCTISSNIPMYFLAWSNALDLALAGLGASSKTWDAYLYSEMLNKQDPLISGTNIKTINGESILGSGNIEVSSGGPSYDDTELNNKVNGLQTQIDTLVSGDASAAIESFNEITAFLNGVEDTENLDGIIAGIEQQITNKQDTVADLETIRSGAALGATALQEHQDISHLATKTEVEAKYTKPSSGIPKSDLVSEVQESLGKADTAIQNVKTINGESILGEGNIEIKANVDTSNLATKEELESLTNEMIANEEVTAAALNELNERVNEISENVSGETATKVELQDAVTSLTNTILENEEISASAFNDINDRMSSCATLSDLDAKQDTLVSGTNIKTINGTSLLGSGNIVISGGGGSSSGSGAYAEVNHGTSDTTFALTPNTFHVWEEVSALTLTLGSETAGVANEYLFQFTSGATATTLSLPSDLKWANDSAPVITDNMIYQVSILKGLATVLEFSKSKTKQCKLNRGYDTIVLEFEDGMTWNDWVNSSYNVYSLYVSGTRVHISSMFIVSGVTSSDVMEEKDYTNLMWD